MNANEGKYRQDDDCAVGEVDLRQLRGDVMDMFVQFLRWDRAATERGCYGVILPILYLLVARQVTAWVSLHPEIDRTSSTLERRL